MIIGVLAAGAFLCLAYYVAIIFYSGFTTSASLIWLLFGLVLGGMAVGVRFCERNPDRLPLWMPVSVVTLVLSGAVVLLTVEGLIFANVPELAAPGMDYVIVLGARVREDELSKTLQKRLDKAAAYLEQNPDTILVLSGGQGADEPFTEASGMYEYLIGKGVLPRQMLLEEKSTSTHENIVYSYHLIAGDRESKKPRKDGPVPAGGDVVLVAPDKPIQIGILTNNFHLYRAKLIARKQGLDNVAGIAAGSDPLLLLHLSVRECIAILKDRLVGNI